MRQLADRAPGAVLAGTDKLFILVLWGLFALSIGLAFLHASFTLALFVGLPLALLPTLATLAAPGKLAPRIAVAVALMLFCALHIHQTHGMAELHFGIFMLLAFLVCYQDWRVIIAAAATAAVHHLSFNFLQEWGYPTICFTTPGIKVVLVHAAYVVCEAAVLSYLALRLQRETATVARSTALLEHSLQTMRASADGVARDMQVISASSDGVAASSADLSARSHSQAARLGQAARAIEALTVAVKANVTHAAQANQLVASAAQLAASGGAGVAEVVLTMAAIRASSGKIADITSVIDALAFQTNILALNAAVEAARAGEAGRGFAVVAQEVRTLAQRSAQAAREVRGLISDSVAQVSAGGTLVDQAGQTMHAIVASVNQVASIMAAIASASAQQRDGIEQMRDTIQEIEQSTEQTALLLAQSTAAVDTMCIRASSVAQEVGTLQRYDALAQLR